MTPTAAPDSIYLNARVLQMNAASSVAEACAVKDGRFVAVGDTDAMRALRGPGTAEVDLEGQTMLPGFNDSHNHVLETGLEMAKVQLGQARTLHQLLDTIKARVEMSAEGAWIVCSAAWHESQLAEGRLPTRWELDAVAPRNPVYLPRGGHTLVINSVALRIAGIAAGTPTPRGGEIKRDPATGEPTGLLFEAAALGLVHPHLPQPSRQQKRQAIVRAMQALHAAGITSVIEPGLAADELDIYRQLRDTGELTMRTSCMVGFGWFNWPAATAANVQQLGQFERSADPLLQVDGIKLFVDGGIESAWLEEPYCLVHGEQDDPAYRGVCVLEPEQLREIVVAANANDWRVGVHAVGDTAIGVVLDAYAAAHARKPLAEKRFVLIHGILPRAEHFARMRELGVVVASQVHHYALGANMVRYWGSQRAGRANPVQEYLSHGIPIAGGTDSMVCPYDQRLAVWSQITRQSMRGQTLGAALGLTREQALKLHTASGSYLTFEEDRKGTIEAGRYADFVVLSHNPMDCGIDELTDIDVIETVVGGSSVWHA